MRTLLKTAFLFVLMTNFSVIKAQDNTDDETTPPEGKQKSFKIGLIVGSYFSNKYTAGIYDGYGFDIDGNRITEFTDSYMYQKIVLQYGGGYGNTDQIAIALNVNHSEWSFDKSDMPVNMHYTPAFLFGLQCRYSVDKKNAISLNLNGTKLNVAGNFTITTLPPTGSTQINNSVRVFGIKGTEQRLMVQIGYNRILGDNEKVNFFVEGGLNMTLSKFATDKILINDLQINLLEFYDYQGVQAGYTKTPIGAGLGVYGAFGLNMTLTPEWTIQLLYSPSYEGINLVKDSRLKLQNAIALRAYYNF